MTTSVSLDEEHSAKPVAVRGSVTSSRVWKHAFGQMLIETCVDGSVWIDGKPVPETLPGSVAAADDERRTREQGDGERGSGEQSA